ncbi:helix-turn-helix domain-containing protein [Microbacterium sp.]|uniref:helix-turn-helix domain-containing protein n=1 Tax=Microbacterium sp. TaxID=51671 RepID=UPI003A8CDF37
MSMITEAREEIDADRIRVATAVRAHYSAAGFSASALAREVGMTQSKMSRRTTGAEPFDIDELSAIARVLEVEIVDLITGTNLPARPIRGGAAAGARRHLYLLEDEGRSAGLSGVNVALYQLS